MMSPNPYASPRPIEEPLEAFVLDDSPPERATPVLKTLAGVVLAVGAVMAADRHVRDKGARWALLAAAASGIAYSASLSDKKEPSAT